MTKRTKTDKGNVRMTSKKFRIEFVTKKKVFCERLEVCLYLSRGNCRDHDRLE